MVIFCVRPNLAVKLQLNPKSLVRQDSALSSQKPALKNSKQLETWRDSTSKTQKHRNLRETSKTKTRSKTLSWRDSTRDEGKANTVEETLATISKIEEI